MYEKRFLHLFPVTTTFAHPGSLVQRCVCTKLEVSTPFLFQQNQRHKTDRQMDGLGATLNVLP